MLDLDDVLQFEPDQREERLKVMFCLIINIFTYSIHMCVVVYLVLLNVY